MSCNYFADDVKKSSGSALEIFKNEQFGSVRAVLIDGEPWFVGNDVASILGYREPKNAVKAHVSDKDRLVVQLSDIQVVLPDHMKGSKIIVINKRGLYNLITKSNTIDIKTKESILSKFNFNYIPYDRKEISFRRCLSDFLDALGIDFIHQFRVDKYRVDFYIPLYRIAIEYDEHDHRRYDREKETKRQKYIEEKLGCRFIRLSDSKSNSYNLGVISKYLK